MADEVRTHDLKTWPEFFAAIKRGEKTFELRLDDRGYRAGDLLRLREYLHKECRYTGEEITVRVPYLVSGPAFGLKANTVCMAIVSLTHPEAQGEDLKEPDLRSLKEETT